MDDMDKVIKSLEIQIKKEIVDNYFAERRYLEEEIQALEDEAAAYRENFARLARRFPALYQALGKEEAIHRVMEVIGFQDRPFLEDFQKLPAEARAKLLQGYPRRGFTAWRRYLNLVLDIYRDLAVRGRTLKEEYDQATGHLRFINEDVEKFNLSFDFGLIAAQMEAFGGGGETLSGGLLAAERDELSTRMRFKHQKLTEAELPPPPALPPPEAVQGRLKEVLGQFGP